MKQALQQGFTSRSRWLLQILGLLCRSCSPLYLHSLTILSVLLCYRGQIFNTLEKALIGKAKRQFIFRQANILPPGNIAVGERGFPGDVRILDDKGTATVSSEAPHRFTCSIRVCSIEHIG